MEEKGVTIKDVESNGILSKNSFYLFLRSDPSLETLIKLANYLEVSIDYIVGNTTENKFHKYKSNQSNFYNTLITTLKSYGINKSKLCKDLGMSRTTIYRWKAGTAPSYSSLITLAKYLRCNIDDLLEHE